jgi:hypothetical protein
LSDHIWLWSRGHMGGGPQAELLRRVAHWLMKEPELEENALLAHADHGRLAVERRSTDPGPPGEVTVTDPDGKGQKVTLAETRPGRGVAEVPVNTPGVWRASDGTRTAYAAAGLSNPLEMADLRATATLLAPLVRATGGSIHWLDPSGAPALRMVEPARTASGSDWIGLQRRHDHLVTGIAAAPLLPPWLALPLIMALAVLAWRREGT